MAGVGRIPFWEWIPGRAWRIVATVEAADEIPDRLPSRGAVLVGSLQRPKWLAFDCPCGDGHRIMVTLDATHRPHWRITKVRKLSVYPSIDYQSSIKRCHYCVSNGQIKWVREFDRGYYAENG
jgi:Family of unknown function (DUF6527)